MKKLNPKGFSAIEGLLILVMIAVIGGTGYFVYNSRKKNTYTTPTAKATTITDFITSEKLPSAQVSEVKTDIIGEGAELFTVQFGEAQDCQSGCFYSSATGLAFGGKLGWLHIENYENSEKITSNYYDFASVDEYLFTEDFSKKLLQKDIYTYDGYIRLLARDKDTPLETLVTISSTVSADRTHSCLVRDLVENTNLKANTEAYSKVSDLYNKNLDDTYVVQHLYNSGFCQKI